MVKLGDHQLCCFNNLTYHTKQLAKVIAVSQTTVSCAYGLHSHDASMHTGICAATVTATACLCTVYFRTSHAIIQQPASTAPSESAFGAFAFYVYACTHLHTSGNVNASKASRALTTSETFQPHTLFDRLLVCPSFCMILHHPTQPHTILYNKSA